MDDVVHAIALTQPGPSIHAGQLEVILDHVRGSDEVSFVAQAPVVSNDIAEKYGGRGALNMSSLSAAIPAAADMFSRRRVQFRSYIVNVDDNTGSCPLWHYAAQLYLSSLHDNVVNSYLVHRSTR